MQQSKKANRWDEQDPFTLFPIEEFEGIDILRPLGLLPKDLRYLVRIRSIEGQQDSKGDVHCNLFEIQNYLYGEVLKGQVRISALRNWAEGGELPDRDVLLLEYLLWKILHKPLTVAQLRKMME